MVSVTLRFHNNSMHHNNMEAHTSDLTKQNTVVSFLPKPFAAQPFLEFIVSHVDTETCMNETAGMIVFTEMCDITTRIFIYLMS